MGIFSENDTPVNSNIIGWGTNEAGFLPVYAALFMISILWTIPHLMTGFYGLAVATGFINFYMAWRTFRSYEAHRNLKRLSLLRRQGLL